MLRTADELAAEYQWESWTGAQVYIQGSYSFDKPDGWIPEGLFRLYRLPARRDAVAFVSLLLMPRRSDQLANFREPLLSTGWARFSADLGAQYLNVQMMTVAHAAFWTPEARADRFVAFGAPPNYPETSIRRVSAQPLYGVTSTDGLRDAIGNLAADIAAHLGPLPGPSGGPTPPDEQV
jgi:hypothetical protein